MKLDVRKFNGKNSFVFWQEKVKDIIINQGLMGIVRKGKKPINLSNKDRLNLEERMLAVIRIDLMMKFIIVFCI